MQENELPVGTAEAEEAEKKAFNSVFEPEQETAPPEEETTASEEPPLEPTLDEKVKDLETKLSKIEELENRIEKRSRDDGGRYGILKQTVEQLQQRIATQTTAGEIAKNSADLESLLKRADDEFEELAPILRAIAGKGTVDPASVEKIVAERLEAQRQAEKQAELEEKQKAFNDSVAKLQQAHPDFHIVRETPEFAEWKSTLTRQERYELSRSNDPDFVSEMFSEFKEWRAKKAEKPADPPPQQTKTRLKEAILPTQGNNKQPRSPVKTEEEAFYAVFNKSKRR